MEMRLIDVRPNDECGCPEEEWVIGGVDVIIHLDPDGSVDVHMDNGDWDHGMQFPAGTGYDQARAKAAAFIAALPAEA